MKHLVPILFLLALAGCGDAPLVGAEGELAFRPDSLDFGDVWIGHPAERSLVLENGGRATVRVELSTDEPFGLEPATLDLSGGASATVRVRFDPREERAFTGMVRLSDGRAIPLAGQGLTPPECPASGACRSVSFDPVSGTCLEDRADDGTACGDACFGGQCLSGECVGGGVDCDDDNACTTDSCDPATGCVHYDDTSACPDDADPCRSPICDPETGCGFAPAPEGLPCGPSNCTTSMVCLAGICSARTTPEGGECGTGSPCQDPGVCIEGACIQDPPFPLEPSWTRAAAPGTTLVWDGVTDGVGQLYWAECTFTTCEIVSVTSRGIERYRRTLFDENVGRAPTGSLALAGDRIVSTLRPDAVEAWSVAVAEKLWTTNLLDLLTEGEPPRDAVHVWVDEAAPPVITSELILLPVEGFRQQAEGTLERWGGWVVALARETGAVRWVWEANGTFDGFIGDEGGSVYFSVRRHGAAPTDGGLLESLGTTGTERWRMSTPLQAPLATLGGFLLQAGGDYRSTEDGEVAAKLPLLVPTFPRRSPLIGGRSLYAFAVSTVSCEAGTCPTWEPHLFRFDRETGDELWRWQLPTGSVSQPVLTTDLSLLVAFPRAPAIGRQSPVLTEIAPDRSQTFTCALPSAGRYDGAASLLMGQWITADTSSNTVMAFGVEKRTALPAGWVTSGGSLDRTARPAQRGAGR